MKNSSPFMLVFVCALYLFFLSNSVELKGQSVVPDSISVPVFARAVYDQAGNLQRFIREYKKVLNPEKNKNTSTSPSLNAGADQAYLDSMAKKIQIFPNPTSGYFEITWDGDIRYLIRSFSVQSLASGNLNLMELRPPSSGNIVSANIDYAAAGTYIVSCALTNGKVVKKKLIRN